MFKKLHRQMTLFCTAITGTILILLTAICLLVAERELKNSAYASFLNEAGSILTHLQSGETVSLEWINQLWEKNGFTFLLYDNGSPLFSQSLTHPRDDLDENLISLALDTAQEDHGISLLSPKNSALPSHAEFTLQNQTGVSYYVSAGTVTKASGTLSFLIFYPLEKQSRQILQQRFVFAAADLVALLLLFIFSWFFTRHMLAPIEANNQRQTLFVASASHELRTPLSVILSGLEAVEKSETQAERSHFTDIMTQEGQRMQHLISDMLLLAHSDAVSLTLSKETCSPDELLLTAYEKYEMLAQKKQIHLKMNLPKEDLATVCCDKERILQVLFILLDNALSYTPAQGTVTLSLSTTKNGICFCISDTGCGVLDKDKKRIFERFYRAEHSRTKKEHFGLGLCIAKEIVTAHHGKIFVNDAPEGGACFQVTLFK